MKAFAQMFPRVSGFFFVSFAWLGFGQDCHLVDCMIIRGLCGDMRLLFCVN